MAWRASRDSTGHQDVATVKIHLLAVGTKMPGWVVTAFEEYTKRMPRECSIELREIPPAHRGKNGNPDRYKADEAQRILSALPRGAHLVVLDELTYMLAFDYLPESEVVSALTGRPESQSVVVTGRGGGQALREAMDTVSEVKEIKHAYRAGISARQGVDY